MICADSRPARPGDRLLGGIDHVGLVVRDAAAEAARWREQGFLVSAPTALHATSDGVRRPLGQVSAHVVFENGYVEISSPVAGAGNHLDPYLALGEGVRIVVHAAADIRAAHDAAPPGTPPPRLASRIVRLPDGDVEARFAWFPLGVPTWPGTLTAIVAHLDRAAVFHAALAAHPNGLRRIEALLAPRGTRRGLPCTPVTATRRRRSG
jgi:hypothetical protein